MLVVYLWNKGVKKQMIVVPTGAGKSYITTFLLAFFFKLCNTVRQNAIFCHPTLMERDEKKFDYTYGML